MLGPLTQTSREAPHLVCEQDEGTSYRPGGQSQESNS